MRQAYRIIPIYTADVSGVCSALYELGGMTVMHDPSGCNSTYNTHDEIRWYDQDSLIFISGLTDIDAIMGNDEKFLQDVEEAKELKPKFIALASSPIPFMNGTDFPGLGPHLLKDRNPGIFSDQRHARLCIWSRAGAGRNRRTFHRSSRENRKVFRSTDGICGKICREEKPEIKSSWSNTP